MNWSILGLSKWMKMIETTIKMDENDRNILFLLSFFHFIMEGTANGSTLDTVTVQMQIGWKWLKHLVLLQCFHFIMEGTGKWINAGYCTNANSQTAEWRKTESWVEEVGNGKVHRRMMNLMRFLVVLGCGIYQLRINKESMTPVTSEQ